MLAQPEFYAIHVYTAGCEYVHQYIRPNVVSRSNAKEMFLSWSGDCDSMSSGQITHAVGLQSIWLKAGLNSTVTFNIFRKTPNVQYTRTANVGRRSCTFLVLSSGTLTSTFTRLPPSVVGLDSFLLD